MAKKMVRGITDVKTINNQDFDTNNVNDLLSDGQYNYIHRKKGKNEEYHNLTDNIKTISSDNTDLLTVTNNNKTTNTATLHPKHDKQKEQVIESTRDTVTIHHGTNGTAEKTTVDTNPQKVLEHENLLTDYGISKSTSGNTTTLGIEYTRVEDDFDLNNLNKGNVRGSHFLNAPKKGYIYYLVSAYETTSYVYQEAIEYLSPNNDKYVRTRINGEWGAWRQQVGDKSVIDALLAQKQDTLVAGDGITIQGNTISASGLTSSIEYSFSGGDFQLFKYVAKGGYDIFVTYTFNCDPAFTEEVLDVNLKNDLEKYVRAGMTVSNGAITLTNDGTNMKLIKSAGSQNVIQQGTFKFYRTTAGGGEAGGYE